MSSSALLHSPVVRFVKNNFLFIDIAPFYC
nr:MAG TPA: hypothetical protein [Caudoviricetes sp.]